MLSTLAPLALAALVPLAQAAVYPVAESMVGDNFLEGWNFPNSFFDNTTSGEVFWYGTADFNGSSPLIYKTDKNTIVMKVDDTSEVISNQWNTTKRFAPKLLSKRAYPAGTVWVMDAIHLPYGCSVWPAFWTVGDKWPKNGEIDIMEGIHNQEVNQMALHTADNGCMAPNTNQKFMNGTWGTANCSIGYEYGTGCTVKDQNKNSYGEPFAAAGGGVYVAEWAADAMKMWFFSRPDVPSSLTADAKQIDTGTLGTPTAYWSNQGCEFAKFFGPQTLIIQTTLCGVWGGLARELEASNCPLASGETCYTRYVNGTGSNFAQAYFEINYVNIFSTATSTSPGVEGGQPADGPIPGNNTFGPKASATVTTVGTVIDGQTTSVQVIETGASKPSGAASRFGFNPALLAVAGVAAVAVLF